MKLYRFLVHISTTHHPYTVPCGHHPKSSLLPSPCTPFALSYPPSSLPSGYHHTVVCVYQWGFLFTPSPFSSSPTTSPLWQLSVCFLSMSLSLFRLLVYILLISQEFSLLTPRCEHCWKQWHSLKKGATVKVSCQSHRSPWGRFFYFHFPSLCRVCYRAASAPLKTLNLRPLMAILPSLIRANEPSSESSLSLQKYDHHARWPPVTKLTLPLVLSSSTLSTPSPFLPFKYLLFLGCLLSLVSSAPFSLRLLCSQMYNWKRYTCWLVQPPSWVHGLPRKACHCEDGQGEAFAMAPFHQRRYTINDINQ